MATQQTANVYITNQIRATVTIQLYHKNTATGFDSGAWVAKYGETVGPLLVHFDTDSGSDGWLARLSVLDGVLIPLSRYQNKGSGSSEYTQCQLQSADAGKNLYFTVDTSSFDINLTSDSCSANMSYLGPNQKVEHVFVLMLENHSFDNMFAMSGIPGITAATTSNSNTYNGVAYPVQKTAPVSMPTDPGHEFLDVVEQLCGPGVKFWNGGVPVGQWSKCGPALAAFNNRLYLAFIANDPSNRILVCSSSDGQQEWNGGVETGQASKAAPALAAFNNRLYLAFIANDPSNRILVCSSPDGQQEWSGGMLVAQQSNCAPSLAVFNGKLWLCCSDGYNLAQLFSSADGQVWTREVIQFANCPTAPSLVTFNSKLCLATGGAAVEVDYSTDGTSWKIGNYLPNGASSAVAPSLAVFYDRLWIAFVASGSNNEIKVCSSADGLTWSNPINTGLRSNVAPALAVFDNRLLLFFVDKNDNSLKISRLTYPIPPEFSNVGFAANYATSTTEYPHKPPSSDKVGDIMKCFDTKNQLPVIYTLATEFALCDQWFSSMPGPTWPNRFFLHGASSSGLDDSPTQGQMTIWEDLLPLIPSDPGFTYPNGSIFDAMNKAKLKWRLYNDYWNHFSDQSSGPGLGSLAQVGALHGVHMRKVHEFTYITQKPSHYSQTAFAQALQQPYDYAYTFIEPNYGDLFPHAKFSGGSSQHPTDDVYGGEALIKATYEAIRNSPLWYSSLLIITYDEHGGFYDSVAPGLAIAPGDNTSAYRLNTHGFNFTQYGVRVPAVIISPLIPKGKVDPTVYDHTSVLATLEKIFAMDPLTERDKKAADLLNLLSLASPRTDCPTILPNPTPTPSVPRAPLSAEEAAAIAAEPVPTSGNAVGFLHIAYKTDLELAESEAEKASITAQFKQIKTKGEAAAYVQKVLAKVVATRSNTADK